MAFSPMGLIQMVTTTLKEGGNEPLWLSESFFPKSHPLTLAAAAAAKSLQSCLTLCDPIDCSPPGSSVPGILQARILERVAISFYNACRHAKLLQSCLTLCDPIDGSPPGSSVPGILQSRILEWVAIAFSNACKWKVKSLSHVWFCETPEMAAHQAPLSTGFSRQEYWSGLPFPSPEL